MLALRLALIATLTTMLSGLAVAQRIAILTPDDTDSSRKFAERLAVSLSDRTKVLDPEMASAAFASVAFPEPYDLALDEAKHVGNAIGCDFFVLVRSDIVRRSSFEKTEYYDGLLAVFLVSTRSGRLVAFTHEEHTADRHNDALNILLEAAPKIASYIVGRAKQTSASEISEKPAEKMEEPPAENSSAAKGFRAPVPFRRIKPEYTKLAETFDVTATVDISIDLDADGKILRTEITRWAGFELDEAVEKAVRSMSWRPAERDGKFVPMRFVVRYNFRKPDKH